MADGPRIPTGVPPEILRAQALMHATWRELCKPALDRAGLAPVSEREHDICQAMIHGVIFASPTHGGLLADAGLLDRLRAIADADLRAEGLIA